MAAPAAAPTLAPVAPSAPRAAAVTPREPFGRGPTAARVLGTVIDAAAWGGSRIPAEVAHAVAVVGGTLEWAARGRKRDRLAANLAHAAGLPAGDRAVRRLVRVEMLNEARRSADLLWALGDRAAARAATRIEGRRHMEAALAEGRGAILAGLHLGGWEIAAAVAGGAIPGRISAVVADDWLAGAMEPHRRAAGLHTVPRSRAALGAARALREGGTVLLLGDDDWGPGARTRRVRLLDGHARLPAGIVALARACRAPIVPFTFLPEGPRRWVGRFEEPLVPPPAGAGRAAERCLHQELADRWSAAIRRAPDHWAASFPIRWEAS